MRGPPIALQGSGGTRIALTSTHSGTIGQKEARWARLRQRHAEDDT